MPARYLLLATVAATAAFGQSVVSVRSGLINYSEGEVLLSGQPLEQKAGKFPELREGAELVTDAGRVEVLLTPGMMLRVGPDSAVRMVSAGLIDTRVEFRRGSAVIEVTEEPSGTMARLLYHDYEFKFPKRGTFRIDSLPREFRVYDGEADVSYLGDKCTLSKNQRVSLYGGLLAETLKRSITDGLDEWSMRRDTQLAADNPPPGDLDGNGVDPGFMISPNAFYGLGGYTSPVTPYGIGGGYGYGSGYGYGNGYGYTPGYIPAFNTYGSYGFMPYPIYIYGSGRSIGYNPPGRIGSPIRGPIGSPIRGPISSPIGIPRGMPRGITSPVTSRPSIPSHPVLGHK
jgi:hypothetical protein